MKTDKKQDKDKRKEEKAQYLERKRTLLKMRMLAEREKRIQDLRRWIERAKSYQPPKKKKVNDRNWLKKCLLMWGA